MIKNITVKMDVIESMLYFWQATNDKEKVGENYIYSIADREEMSCLYDEEFDRESVRKVLSAISNREILNSNSKRERKFWNNNMWMMEDLEYTNMMIKPLKVLNLDDAISMLDQYDTAYDALEVHFIPGLHEEYQIVGNKVFINFFRVKPDLYVEDKVTVGDVLLKEYVVAKLEEAVK
ncbi:MAG: hypothetical protein JXO44_08310 [Clostridia bacterium]|nr:hypothetical protein [Clostridia bacterium]